MLVLNNWAQVDSRPTIMEAYPVFISLTQYMCVTGCMPYRFYMWKDTNIYEKLAWAVVLREGPTLTDGHYLMRLP